MLAAGIGFAAGLAVGLREVEVGVGVSGARSMATPVLVDGRNLFQPDEAIAAGFDYTGMGRAARPRMAATTLQGA